MTIKRNGDKVILKGGKVSCSCCEEECLCGSMAISGELLNILQNATSATCYGFEGSFSRFGENSENFAVDWGFAFASFIAQSRCLSAYSLGLPLETNSNSIELGKNECVDLCNEASGAGTCSIAPDIVINGISFPAFYTILQPDEQLPETPVFVFS